MPNTLIGKIALVTGGSRGIGAAVVRRLASDGATVAFSYAVSEDHAKSLVAEVAKAGGTALAIQADSADADAVKGAVAQAVDSFGGLDILVNNAGILIGGIVDDYPLADFDRMIAVNVRAVFIGHSGGCSAQTWVRARYHRKCDSAGSDGNRHELQ